MKRKVTISVDSKTYSEYQRFCEDRGFLLSKQLELFMKDAIKRRKDE